MTEHEQHDEAEIIFHLHEERDSYKDMCLIAASCVTAMLPRLAADDPVRPRVERDMKFVDTQVAKLAALRKAKL